MVFYQEAAVVQKNQPLNETHHWLTLLSPQLSAAAQPGQFLEIKCSDDLQPLLRRPFGLSAIRPISQEVDIIYRRIGPGTNWLAGQNPGSKLSVIGPLGRGFSFAGPDNGQNKEIKTVLIVAGGTGLAPLVPLVKKLAARQVSLYSFLGFKSRAEVFGLPEMIDLSDRLWLSTDDGSRIKTGLKYPKEKFSQSPGLISDIFRDNLRDILQDNQTKGTRKIKVFSCGPWPMMKKIAETCQRFNLPGEVSLETMMGCGFGLCLGCAWPTRSGYQKVCTDGPVFPMEQVLV